MFTFKIKHVAFTLLVLLFIAPRLALGDSLSLKTHTKEGSEIALMGDSLKSASLADPVLTSDEFIEKAGAFVGDVRSELTPLGVTTDSMGMDHVRYQQVYMGVPVYGAEVTAHLDAKGHVKSVTGRTLKGIDAATSPVISEATAKKLAKRAYRKAHPWKEIRSASRRGLIKGCRKRAKKEGVAVKKSTCLRRKFRRVRKSIRPKYSANTTELLLYSSEFVSGGAGDDLELSYKLLLTNRSGQTEETYYLSAITGELLYRFDGIHGSNRKVFDCSPPNDTDCWLDSRKFYLLEGGSTPYYHGRSENPSSGPIPRGPVPFSGQFFGSTDVDDTFDLIGVIEGYLDQKFSRDGGNARGGMGDGVSVPFGESKFFVHNEGGLYGSYCPALGAWAGTTSVSLCTGNVQAYDLVGHEYGHIVARHINQVGASGFVSLGTTGEAGALLESFADFLGEGLEHHITGSNDWLFGTGLSYTYLRDFADPPAQNFQIEDDYPDTYTHPDFLCEGDDIHTNTGVINKAVYLMAEGGEHSDCNVSGIGFSKVEQIWYRALTTYFQSAETFPMAYNSFQLACADFAATTEHGITTADCAEVTKALQAVKMDLDGGCGGTDGPEVPATCASVDPGVPGDFDGDTDVDATDYMIWYDIVTGVNPGSLDGDANGDNEVNEADCDIWKENAGVGACLPFGRSAIPCNTPDTFDGDFDADYDVDADDYFVWASSYGAAGAGGPLVGDGNSDGMVDGADYLFWQQHVGMGRCDFSVPALVGDLDGDMDSDADDHLFWYNEFMLSTTGEVPNDNEPQQLTLPPISDVNGDGNVDSTDCEIIKSSYSIGLCPPIGYEGEACAGTDSSLIAGDGNFDGVNSHADYTVWRDNYGSTTGAGDYNGDGRADAADYTVWRNNLGSGSCSP